MTITTSRVPIARFLSNYLPNINADAFNAVVKTLKDEKVLVSTGRTKGQRFSKIGYGFASLKSLFLSPSPNPNTILESLRTVCEVVNEALEKLGIRVAGDQRLSIRADDDKDLSGNACFAKKSEGPLSAFDAVVPVIVRERNEEAESDIMGRVVESMNSDARRAFTYGITICHDEMTLSRYSRSHVIQSVPLRWTESADVLIRVLISLLTATDEQLGYDPLITLLPDGSYVYQLPQEGSSPLFYQTLDLISHYPSTRLGDRNARIWMVKQVVSPSNRLRVGGTSDRVLKDVWVDAGKRTEAEAQEDLFQDISAVASDRNWRKRPIFQDFFERDVESLAEALQGDNFKRYFSCIVAKHVQLPGEALAPRTSSSHATIKRRCFFVYEDVCTPLHDIPTFGEVIDILKQCVTALRLMFCAGWVHRDISTGNILAARPGSGQPWQVKLSDLEYSTRFPDASGPRDEHTIGTPFFMPCEIHTSEHYFPLIITERGQLEEYPDKPIVYGYQHDLESIWWVILWFASMRVDQEDLCREFGRLHFQQPMDLACIRRRRGLLGDMKHLSSDTLLVNSLPDELLDSNFLSEMQKLRFQIHGEYTMRNAKGNQEDIGTYSYVVSQTFTLFFERLEESRDIWDSLELITDTQLRHERAPERREYRAQQKRKVDEVEGSEDGEDTRVKRKVVEKRGRKDGRENQGRPTKRAHLAASVPEVQAPNRRSGPVTRSMTRAAQNTGPTTRAAARRMREAAASKNKTSTATTTTRKSRR